MTYDEKRAQYGSDEEMARAMFHLVVNLQGMVILAMHCAELDQGLRQRAESKLFRLQNPIRKTNYIMEHA